jgi:hypothetical protein
VIKKFPNKFSKNNINHHHQPICTDRVDLNNNKISSENCKTEKVLEQFQSNFLENLRSFYLFNDSFNKNIVSLEENFDCLRSGKQLISFVKNFTKSTRVQSTFNNININSNLVFDEIVRSTQTFVDELNSNLHLTYGDSNERVESYNNPLIEHEIKPEP